MERVRQLNQVGGVRAGAGYVLYWAQMNRRTAANQALNFAADLANREKLPLLVYEGVTCTYPYASDRLHTFLLEGVPDTASELERQGIGYCFYLRRRRADPNDMLYRLAEKAAAVVTDDYPTFIAASHNARVPARIGVPYFAVDASAVVPMERMEKREYAAYTIRPKIQRLLGEYLKPVPSPKVARPWEGPPPAGHVAVSPANIPALVADCEIDHSVPPSTAYTGGSRAAQRRLQQFLRNNLRRYARERNNPSSHATSELSPYLHFGHIAALDIALRARAHAAEHKLIADEFLEELIVRRELAFNFARYAGPELTHSLDALPDWARATLAAHDRDPRPASFTPREFEQAATNDPLWNATQKELLLRGKIHGYYRMYWGKKIIEWSSSHREALETMITLHDRYALDGRDPNTYTNILWCFGLHDRPWLERPVFGQIRYMGLEGMKRKTDVTSYIAEIEALQSTGRDPLALTWRRELL
jgi:deoxyribodipyrimidine photo-lyase